METMKKIIKNKLNSNIKFYTKKLNNSFGRENVTEEEIFDYVKNIHYSHLAIKSLLKDDYDFIDRNGKYFYQLPNGKLLFLMKKNRDSLDNA